MKNEVFFITTDVHLNHLLSLDGGVLDGMCVAFEWRFDGSSPS